jgi:hypothetical protein
MATSHGLFAPQLSRETSELISLKPLPSHPLPSRESILHSTWVVSSPNQQQSLMLASTFSGLVLPSTRKLMQSAKNMLLVKPSNIPSAGLSHPSHQPVNITSPLLLTESLMELPPPNPLVALLLTSCFEHIKPNCVNDAIIAYIHIIFINNLI